MKFISAPESSNAFVAQLPLGVSSSIVVAKQGFISFFSSPNPTKAKSTGTGSFLIHRLVSIGKLPRDGQVYHS